MQVRSPVLVQSQSFAQVLPPRGLKIQPLTSNPTTTRTQNSIDFYTAAAVYITMR